MNSSWILSITTFGYALAGIFYIAGVIFKKPTAYRIGFWALILTVAGLTIGIGLRWIESYQLGIGHAPLSGLYESLVFFAWVLGITQIWILKKYDNPILAAFVVQLAFLLLAYASLGTDAKIQPLLPALQSNWLIVHVATCFIGYAAFAIAFAISILYLIKSKKEANKEKPSRLPDLETIEALTYQLVMFGFLFLTAGIITGAVWANSAWGRYWGWDPKETWSLITWFIYAALLHVHTMRGWRGKRIAWLSILGFIAVLVTYFGVNYLSSLHSYGAL